MKIGKFEILAELGNGSMGAVYEARDPVLDRRVALKTVAPGLLSQRDAVERFQREARAAARLQHPNVVTIFELGETGETVFIAMELLEGMDLARALVPADRLTLREKLKVVVDVCRGLDYAHKQGIVHRDVKPANIRVRPDGSVKIVDFGIARVLDATNLTATGLVLGTPSYMAPEMLEGRGIDHRADMWAVGIILYEVLTGRRPFEAETIPSLVYRIVHEPLPRLDADKMGVPEDVVAVAAQALNKEPAQRFPDLAAMADALEKAMGLPTVPALPPEVRAKAYERHFAEARRLLADRDLEGALLAARRAQSLQPSRTGIVALISVIEQQIGNETTSLSGRSLGSVVSPARGAGFSATMTILPAPGSATQEALRPLPTPVLTELRIRGAACFRELATFGEPPSTQSVCLSPVRDLLAASGTDGAIRLWDLHSRTRILTLRTELHERTGHDASAISLAFSPDGALLASGHVDNAVHLWDLGKGTEVPVRLRHDAMVGALAFSPDGSTLASGSMDANLRLWDVGAALSGEARRELHRQPSGVTAVAYAAGGDLVVTGHARRVLRVIDAMTGRLVASLRGPDALVNLLCLAPDGRHLAVGSHDRTIRLYDLEEKKQVALVASHKRPAISLSFFDDGQHFATVAQDNAVYLWDVEKTAPLAALWGPPDESFAGVALFGNNDHIAVALADGRIRLWGPAH
jgi:WD40 repeat protein/tRNA A-37 threonylcarbamoyl transferase component Bud32